MVRQLEIQDSEIEFQRYHPGCMWGLFHILDHHHLHSLKKWPPRRKHGRGKRAICCTNPKTVSFEHFPEEVHEYLDAEAVPLLVEPECSLPNRVSSNSTVKALVAKEMSVKSPLNRTPSIHHLEPSDGRFATRSANWANPIIILHASADKTSTKYSHSSEKSDRLVKRSLNQNLLGAKHLDRGISCPQFDYMDVLEIFKVNKKLFMEIQEEPDIKMEKQRSFRANASLKKSGSFPATFASNISPVRPTTLEHKQKEIWYFPKGEKLSPEVQVPEIYSPKASKDSYGKSQVLKADTGSEDALVSHGTNLPPPAFSQGSNKHWHHSVTARIKYIKRKIKQVLKESRKENNQRVPVGSQSFTEVIPSERADMEALQKSDETKGSDDAPIRVMQRNMSTSLNESMERYTQLFESTISKETKWSQHQSKSLRLTNEDKTAQSGNGLKSFRRRLSLSDLDSFVSFSNEVFRDAFSSEFPKGYDINDEKKSHTPTNVFEESRPQEEVLETLGDDEAISKTVLEVNDRVAENGEQMNTGESDYSVTVENLSREDNASGFQDIASQECDENVNIMAENYLLPFEFKTEDESDFSYVRDVLELAGFTDEDCLGKWHSLDQPMSSTLFKELEDFLHGQCSSGETAIDCDHRLLFDLINKELLDIHETSLAYFPKPFSFKQPPKRSRLVEEVWKRIQMYQKTYTDEQSLDDIVGRDLEKRDGWMNLLFEVEDVALDLEDLIFNELLDEVICS